MRVTHLHPAFPGRYRHQSLLWLPVILAVLLTAACSDTANTTSDVKKKPRPAHLVAINNSKTMTLSTPSTRSGTLLALRQVRVFNQEEGKITSLAYYPGDTFKKGDVLVSMDGSLLRAQLDKAIATRKQAEQDLRRTNSLVKKRLAAEDERARFETTLTVAQAEEQLLRTRLAYTTIRAPFAGTIAERLLEPGDIAPRHTHLLTVIDPRSMITRVHMSELLLSLLKTGDPASITIDALGKQAFNGTISRIYPTVDPQTRLGTIEVSFDKVPPLALAGSLCRVTVTPPARPYLMIPFTALRRDEQGEYVFTINGQQQATKKYVTTGIRHQNLIAINSGLEEGAAVIIKGFLGLKEGKKVSTSVGSKQASRLPS
jgi:membrane fusion protein (multidrug efflux system)